MTTTHSIFQFIGGDDWEIQFELLDEHNNPIDITNAEIKWTLVNASGQHVIDVGDYTLALIDAVGGVGSIMVAATKTTTIIGGRYNDALRITTGGITSTMSMGPIQVITDPWMISAIPATQVVTLRAVRAA